jgi:hypothetical protein
MSRVEAETDEYSAAVSPVVREVVLGHLISTLPRDRMGGAKVDGKGNTL